MVTIVVKDLEGETQHIDANPGDNLMEVLRDSDYEEIEAVCGGIASCGTCHVFVEESWCAKLNPQKDDEKELISSLDAAEANSRLSCQIIITDEMDKMNVTVAPMQD